MSKAEMTLYTEWLDCSANVKEMNRDDMRAYLGELSQQASKIAKPEDLDTIVYGVADWGGFGQLIDSNMRVQTSYEKQRRELMYAIDNIGESVDLLL